MEQTQDYDDKLVTVLEALWGDGYLSPGGNDETSVVLQRVHLTGARVVDLGCGTGGSALFIAEQFDPAEVVGRYLANKRLIEGICTSFEVRPLFVWQPVPCYRYDGPLVAPHDDDNPVRERLLACIRQGYEIMDARRAAGACGAHFLWLADMQAGRTDGLYVDADHYTPAFSREIAEAIASALGPGAR